MASDLLSQTVRITEIFYSLQGETRTVGLPTVFVRLTGCPLRCQYCDTAYAFHGGKKHSLEAVLNTVARYFPSPTSAPRYVTVTGGEPLAQPNCLPLLEKLCDAGFVVSLETSGALDVSAVDARVVKVLDVKTPGSGECDKNRFANFDYLTSEDQVKFVICDRADYEWSQQCIARHQLIDRCEVLFSPSFEQLPANQLADWIVADRLAVRYQLQLHKILWNDEPGR